jgi:hypothetical protein
MTVACTAYKIGNRTILIGEEAGQMDSTSNRRREQSLNRSHRPRRGSSSTTRMQRRLEQVHGRLPRDTQSAPHTSPSDHISLDEMIGTE